MKTYKVSFVVEYSRNVELSDDTIEKGISKLRDTLETDLVQDEFVDELYINTVEVEEV